MIVSWLNQAWQCGQMNKTEQSAGHYAPWNISSNCIKVGKSYKKVLKNNF